MALTSYKCPNCGGGLKFDPESQRFRCEYCLSSFSEEEMKAFEEKGAEDAPEKDGAAVIYSCPSCGAEIIADETTAATFCYYCHNPVVLSGRLSGEFLPGYVLPFGIDKKKAMDIFSGWMRKKKFLPRAFYSEKQVEKFSGVYFPYWIYSCRVDGRITADAETSRTWTAGRIRYTEHKKYEVEREGELDVRNLTRNALSRANHELAEGVLPFDMEKLQPFQMGYLSGFLAEKRDTESSQFEAEAEQEVKDYAVESLRASVTGYDWVKVREQDTKVRDPKWDYALLPVWVMTYQDRRTNKQYYFAMNGQTGKICGRLPVDKGKLAALFAGVFFPVLAVLLIGGWFLS